MCGNIQNKIFKCYNIFFLREESHKFVNGLKNEINKEETTLQQIIPRFTLNTICGKNT